MNDFVFDSLIGQAVELPQRSRRNLKRAYRFLRSRRFSANLIVDLGGTAVSLPTLAMGGGGLGTMSGQIGIASGLAYPASGGAVGMSVDLLHADTFCNLMVAGQLIFGSGQLRIAVQTSDADTSGTYTDPTSGLAQLPTYFQSGGILWLNSGALLGGVIGAQVSGQSMQSGFTQFAGFQRPGRYARANMVSGDFYVGPLSVSFVSQQKTTGSGGGYSLSPGSGTVNV